MKKAIFCMFVLLNSWVVHASELDEQLEAFEAVEEQNNAAARERFRAQDAYDRQQENLRQAEARAKQRVREEGARAAAAEAALANEEKLRDKARIQAREDEEHALEIELKRAKLEEIKALAAAKAARANEILDAELAEKKASTDVIQSNADATRNVSEGTKELQTGIGKGAEAAGGSWFK